MAHSSFHKSLLMSTSTTISEFLNSQFNSIDTLSRVDTIITEKSANNNNNNNTITSTNSDDCKLAQDVIIQLRELLNNVDENSLTEINKLLDKYGNEPAITYTKMLIKQKLQMIHEFNINKDFSVLLDKICDYEMDELYDKEIESYDDVFSILSDFRNQIDEFYVKYKDVKLIGDPHKINIDINRLHRELNDKLFATIRSEIKGRLYKKLSSNVKNWDNDKVDKHIEISTDTIKEFQLLTKFQLIASNVNDISTFWAIDALITQLNKKFKFHFESDHDTNRLDKPEFAFNYIIGYLNNNLSTISNKLAIPFIQCCKSYNAINGSFSTWFIKSILPMMKRKFVKELDYLVEIDNTNLLSHFVNELKKFDFILKTEFSFIPNKDIDNEWFGLTNELILENEDVWTIWLKNEKTFVNNRFNEIIEMNDAFLIDYEIVEIDKTKPTKSSINLKNLINGITLNYQSLPLKFQLKFLSEVQLKLLNFYFDTLKKGFNALKGIKNVVIDNVSTLERICRIWCSGKYMIEIMNQWNNDIIFIDLWKSLNDQEDFENTFEKTFFESVIKGYEKDILNKIPNLVMNYFDKQLNKTMKDYFQSKNNWTSDISINNMDYNDLQLMIKAISNDMSYLRKTLSTSTYNEWKYLLSNTIATYFEKNIALMNNFSRDGAVKLQIHVDYVFDTLELVKSTTEGYGHLKAIIRVLETGKVNTKANDVPLLDDYTLEMLLMRRV